LNNILHYKLSFKELNINKNNILKHLGYPAGKAPDPYPEILEDLLIISDDLSDIQSGFVISKNIRINPDIIVVNGIEFNTGNIISSSLEHSESVAIFVCTAGAGIENYSRELMKEDKTIEAYMLDMIGSEVVESAMDIFQDSLEKEMNLKSLNISNRYSPGYCDWNVSEQHKLFSLLPDYFCNIKLKESALMVPIKSVSGILGIGEKVVKKSYACDHCDQQNCIYRKGKF